MHAGMHVKVLLSLSDASTARLVRGGVGGGCLPLQNSGWSGMFTIPGRPELLKAGLRAEGVIVRR